MYSSAWAVFIESVAGVLCKMLGLEQGIHRGGVVLGLEVEWLAGLNLKQRGCDYVRESQGHFANCKLALVCTLEMERSRPIVGMCSKIGVFLLQGRSWD